MATKPLPSPEVLRQLLRYEPETGNFLWRYREHWMFTSRRSANSWNAKHSGKPALIMVNDKGYRSGRVLGTLCAAHRVAWAMTHDRWPVGDIDHIDGNPSNNKISNLRAATRSQNQHNQKAVRGGTSKYKGVSQRESGAWRAMIRVDRQLVRLGQYQSEEDAARAYDRAAVEYFGCFARPNFPVGCQEQA